MDSTEHHALLVRTILTGPAMQCRPPFLGKLVQSSLKIMEHIKEPWVRSVLEHLFLKRTIAKPLYFF